MKKSETIRATLYSLLIANTTHNNKSRIFESHIIILGVYSMKPDAAITARVRAVVQNKLA